MKCIVKHDYDNITELGETTLRKAVVQARIDIPPNITTRPVRTNGHSTLLSVSLFSQSRLWKLMNYVCL